MEWIQELDYWLTSQYKGQGRPGAEMFVKNLIIFDAKWYCAIVPILMGELVFTYCN